MRARAAELERELRTEKEDALAGAAMASEAAAQVLGDMGRYRERWADVGRYGDIYGDMGRYREIWGDAGRSPPSRRRRSWEI